MKQRRPSPRAVLRELESLRACFGDGSGARKAALLGILARARLPTAGEVLRLHEAACFLRAHPDDAAVLAAAEQVLAGFARRADLRRFRRALADTGIAGTAIHYEFYGATARRLAARHGPQLRVDWPAFADRGRLEARLPLLASYAETPGLDEVDEALLGGAQCGRCHQAKGALLFSKQLRDDGGRVDREKAAMVDQRLAGCGLRDPGRKPDLVERRSTRAEDRNNAGGAEDGMPGHHAAPRSAVLRRWRSPSYASTSSSR